MDNEGLMVDFRNYIADGLWKCDKSPTNAHWWIEVTRNGCYGLFSCKYCHETRLFPINMETARTVLGSVGTMPKLGGE